VDLVAPPAASVVPAFATPAPAPDGELHRIRENLSNATKSLTEKKVQTKKGAHYGALLI
jgi:hypothetical protein